METQSDVCMTSNHCCVHGLRVQEPELLETLLTTTNQTAELAELKVLLMTRSLGL